MNSKTDSVYIPKPYIFSFSECLHFLDRGYDDCLYTIDAVRVLKPLLIGNSKTLIQVVEKKDNLEVSILLGRATGETLTTAANYVSAWFDLKRDLRPFYRLLKKSEHLSWMPDQFGGLRMIGIPDLFEALCWCVIGQQINLTFAHRIKRKLVEMYGTSITYNSKQYYYFPEPEVLADLQISELKKLQFSRQKAEYIIGIAQKFANGALTKQQLQNQETYQEMLKQLKTIRGVGDWTANYVLMKSLQNMNCITHGDTGLQSAVSSILDLDRKPTRSEIEAFFTPFRGWESYLNIYLWRTLS